MSHPLLRTIARHRIVIASLEASRVVGVNETLKDYREELVALEAAVAVDDLTVPTLPDNITPEVSHDGHAELPR